MYFDAKLLIFPEICKNIPTKTRKMSLHTLIFLASFAAFSGNMIPKFHYRTPETPYYSSLLRSNSETNELLDWDCSPHRPTPACDLPPLAERNMWALCLPLRECHFRNVTKMVGLFMPRCSTRHHHRHTRSRANHIGKFFVEVQQV